jgi:hypothetical protein
MDAVLRLTAVPSAVQMNPFPLAGGNGCWVLVTCCRLPGTRSSLFGPLTYHAARRIPHAAYRTPHTAHRTPHSALRTPHSAHRTPQLIKCKLNPY